MGIYAISVKRKITISMAYLAVILSGIAVIFVMRQELFPPVAFPQLTIVTPYSNAAPEEIETLVTKLIEESIATVKKLKTIRSFSREGVSIVIAEFDWGTDMNFASLNLREKIDLVKERLPREAEEPLVLKFNPFSKPVMIYSIVSKGKPDDPNTIPLFEILKIAKDKLKDKLEKVPGVASVTISGGLEKEIKVDLNLNQMISHKINILDVPNILKDSNLNYPGGSVKEAFYESLVRTMGEYKNIRDIEETLVSTENIKKGKYDRARKKQIQEDGERGEDEENEDKSSQYIFLRDIAQISEGFKERSSYSRYQGKENISLTIQKQASANIIETVKLVKKELERLRNETNIIPKDIELTLVYDESEFIKSAIKGVVQSAYEGGILAFLTLFMFLRSFKSAFIVTVSIPISAIATLIAMYFYDISLNMMSLGGLALGVGMLVDAAIVVVENIERHKGMGKSPVQAAIDGGEEIFAPLFSSTLTQVAVFLPMSFVYGISGELFKPISFTIVFSNLASLVCAVTLLPMLTTLNLGKGGGFTEVGKFMLGIQELLAKFLNKFLKFSKTGLLVIVLLLVSAILLMNIFEVEIMPKVDQGQFNIKIDMPTGTVLDRTNEVADLMEKELLKNKDVQSVSSSIGSDRSAGRTSINALGAHQAQIIVKLKKERTRTTHVIILELQEKVEEFKKRNVLQSLRSAEIVYTAEDNPFAGAFESSSPIAINITGNDFEKLNVLVKKVQEMLEKEPGVYNIRNDIPSKSPEIRITPNRQRAAMNGISSSDIAQTSLIALRGSIATKLKNEGKETDVLVRVKKETVESIDGIENIPIFMDDNIIPLKEVTEIFSGRGPSEIKRLDQIRIYNVYGDIKGRSTTETLRSIEKTLKKITSYENYYVGFGQEYEDKKKSNQSLFIIFIVSVVLVYMIMASQFESLLQPFIIMMTVPLSVIGVSYAMFLTNTSINAMSMLGLIMLCGIVVNNGIVVIEFVNQLREEGHPLEEAIILSVKTRLRPILMTTISTLLGLLPLALALEEGSEFQAPMAIATIGGLSVSTLLTLFVIPALYVLTEKVIIAYKKKKLLA